MQNFTKTLIKQSRLQCPKGIANEWKFMIFLQCQPMRPEGMLAPAHPPTDGAQRGPDTHSVILLKNMESPGNAARLFAETQSQCCTCIRKRNSTADASHAHGNLTENLIKQIHFALSQDTTQFPCW